MASQPTGAVTLLFTDIEGSTSLLREAEDGYADLLHTHQRLLRDAFSRHEGFEVDTAGDAFFVAFPSARDAVAAAREAQQALAAHPWPKARRVWVRMGMHTGSPRALDGRYVGLDVHHAARVMAAGHGGQVLLTEATRRAIGTQTPMRDLGEHRLKDLLGPQRLFQLTIEGLPVEFPPLKTLGSRFTNLPVLGNALIGREQQLDDVTRMLRGDCRIVTLTGPGGIGKTRLGLQVAADLLDDFTSGVYFVPLAEIRDPKLVLPAVAHGLGLREQPGLDLAQVLHEYLADKRFLLLLDNLEQVIDAAAGISSLLRRATDLRVLVTSREPLRIEGEHVYEVPALGLPVDGPPEQSEAVQLFVTRAASIDGSFELDETNLADAVSIVRRLDGIPLAIELAAARARAFSVRAILERLDRSLDLLTTGRRDGNERQRTLRATIQWSYDLLTAEEQRVFRWLAIFAGGCRLTAAESVCGDGALDAVASLVDKSLLRRREDPDSASRYWMLETIREFGLARLDDAGETGDAEAAYVTFITGWAEEAAPGWVSAYVEAAGAVYASEMTNLRTAASILAKAGQRAAHLRLVVSMWPTWYQRGLLGEGRALLQYALELDADADLDPWWRACALGGVSACALRLGDYAEAAEYGRRSVELARVAGDPRLLSHVLRDWSNGLAAQGHLRLAEQALEEAFGASIAAGDSAGAYGAKLGQSHLALAQEDWHRAIAITDEVDAITSAADFVHPSLQAIRAFNRGVARLHLGDIENAEVDFVFALGAVDRSFVEGVSYPLSALAAVADRRGDTNRAAFLLGVTDELVEHHGMAYDPLEEAARQELRERLRTQLGPDYTECVGLGRAAQIDEVVQSYATLDAARSQPDLRSWKTASTLWPSSSKTNAPK